MKGCLYFIVIMTLAWVIPMPMPAHVILTIVVCVPALGFALESGERGQAAYRERLRRHARRVVDKEERES